MPSIMSSYCMPPAYVHSYIHTYIYMNVSVSMYNWVHSATYGTIANANMLEPADARHLVSQCKYP